MQKRLTHLLSWGLGTLFLSLPLLSIGLMGWYHVHGAPPPCAPDIRIVDAGHPVQCLGRPGVRSIIEVEALGDGRRLARCRCEAITPPPWTPGQGLRSAWGWISARLLT